MKIGLISSYNAKCGIAAYSENLVEGLRLKGLEVKVACNYEDSIVIPGLTQLINTSAVSQFFHTPFITYKTEADIPGILEFFDDCSLIHIQMETNLYHPNYIHELVKQLKKHNKLLILTMHSAGLWTEFNTALVDHWISHDTMWVNNFRNSSIIPMGVRFFDEVLVKVVDYNSICSFGLGRNNDDILRAAIGDKYTYKTSYGSSKWLPLNELVEFIKSNWVISLFYPPIPGTNVSSSAIMLALGCNRPILTSNTEWFNHINYPSVYKVPFDGNVKDVLDYLMDVKNIPSIVSDMCRTKEMIIKEKRTFDDFVDNHVSLYKNLLKNSDYKV